MASRLALLVAMTLATPLFAQDGSEPGAARTPESAQRFLTQLLVRPERLWHDFNVYRLGSAVSDEPRAGAAVVIASGEIADVRSENRCVTRMQLDQAQVAQLAPGETGNLRITGGRTERRIDWSKVESLEKITVTSTQSDPAGQVIQTTQKYGVAVVMQGGWQRLRFVVPAEAERDRLVFAIEFLKSACELKSDTGF